MDIPNNAPPQWRAQGAVLNAFAAHEGSTTNLSMLLDEGVLRGLGSASPKDRPLPANATPAQWRFHCRRHIVAALGWSEHGERRELPNDVNAALYERWWSPPVERTGFRARA